MILTMEPLEARFAIAREEDFSEALRFSGDSEQESELRRLAVEYDDFSLDELAKKLRLHHSVANAEKQRQIFGFCWLKRNCEAQADAAVQRNHIYAQYVDSCNALRTKPLNPASFGKLVRLLFPAIKTRRLGTRGHSKYHYCGIRLRGECFRRVKKNGSGSPQSGIVHQSGIDSTLMQSKNVPSPPIINSASNLSLSINPSVDTAALDVSTQERFVTETGNHNASHSSLTDSHGGTTHSQSSHPQSHSPRSTLPSISTDPSLISPVAFDSIRYVPCLHLAFIPPHRLPWIPNLNIKAFTLPPLNVQLPEPYNNEDAKRALSTVYAAHCTTLIESVRFMHLKQFLSQIASFPSTLSSPLLTLLSAPELGPWIEQADIVMYREIIRLLFPMTLQVVPPPVLVLLRHLAANLESHVSSIYASHSNSLRQAKVMTATVFGTLLSRLLRVNDTAHAAARFLANPADRQLICGDWNRFIDVQYIVYRELSGGHKDAISAIDEWYRILSSYNTCEDGIPKTKEGEVGNGNYSVNRVELRQIDGVLDRMADFFLELPSRFPSCSPKLFLLNLSALLTGILREITVSGGEAFGALWVIRCWIDEYVTWVAEIGGYLEDDRDHVNIQNTNVHGNIMESALNIALDSGSSLNGNVQAGTQNVPANLMASMVMNNVQSAERSNSQTFPHMTLHPELHPGKEALIDQYRSKKDEEYMSIVFDGP
ncbi:transcriptional repressor Sak1 [Schizosaccharomyces japonicus yFS275]|uniref:Transcriptional repressor Sak1 n=1 Tax=Schizosaccharomyces japonicus (strain yFS275 / FY16936) TaxID=402676 RepID=B6K7W5_SCHJY|nr:transcriptional repressor Sak1 [Schizosaccharomyces japonicus yFS275]EEB09619.2 transcriptional repressor Sak1 [Schizosaccharomyces japonicus yFS275]